MTQMHDGHMRAAASAEGSGIEASIVIPAHNEEWGIVGCLSALASHNNIDHIEVVVVANGCLDATADAARRFQGRIPHLTVLELAIASKPNALNAGDALCTAFPRIYLDADIVLGTTAIDGLIAELNTSAARVGSPNVHFEMAGANAVVRAFYRTYARLPYVRNGLIGLGVYALSEEGRARFGRFPELTSDDLFVQHLFTGAERRKTVGSFTVRTPRNTRDLVRVRTRVAQGNRQLARAGLQEIAEGSTTASHTFRALLGLLRKSPQEVFSVTTYVGVILAARLRARFSDDRVWWRDESSRFARRSAITSEDGVQAKSRLNVAYLISQYPAPSHVFIEREIVALRQRGVRVETFSARPTPERDLLSVTMREEASRTRSLQARRGKLLLATIKMARRHPSALGRGIRRALTTGEATLVSRAKQLAYLIQAILLREYLASEGIWHIHVHFANNGADIARAAVSLGRDVDGPSSNWSWTFTMHGPTEFEDVTHYDLAAKVRSASAVACITAFTRSQMMLLCEEAQWSKMTVVPMCVDTERFVPPASRQEHSGSLRVLFVGRLVPEKGPSVLIEALDVLLRQGDRFEAKIIGAGPLEDALRHDVAKRGLGTSVQLLGAVGQEEILDHYHWADVLCLPSFQEGLPVVLMEAMSTELPVVTTPVAAIPELVTESTGILVAPGRPDLLAAALSSLASDPSLRREMGAHGRLAVRSSHTLEFAGQMQHDFLSRK